MPFPLLSLQFPVPGRVLARAAVSSPVKINASCPDLFEDDIQRESLGTDGAGTVITRIDPDVGPGREAELVK